MDGDIRLFINQCSQCNKTKHPRKKPKTRLRTYIAGYPLDRIGIDIMGPLNVTKDKNKIHYCYRGLFYQMDGGLQFAEPACRGGS